MKFKTFILLAVLFCAGFAAEAASNRQESDQEKITRLNELIAFLEGKEIDAQKERLTVRTAQVFLAYANWDEVNVDLNESYFAKVSKYKSNAAQMAADLPDFERNDVLLMLDEAIAYAELLDNGEVTRKPCIKADWGLAEHEGNQIVQDGQAVFLADYTWKPNIPQLTQYYGNKDGFFISPTYSTNKNGGISDNIANQLNEKPSGTLGFIFIAQNNVPDWLTAAYGTEVSAYGGEPFTKFDIDHPGIREMQSSLLSGIVPKMAGKKYSDLGYMLCNEPRWITYKDGDKKVWYNGAVSEYTKDKFRLWLSDNYASIDELNQLWESDFLDFENVKIEIPIDISNIGNAKWYDWSAFNDYRVVEYYTFMKDEILKHDAEAKVHLKIMPSFFTENLQCSGIDLEALTELSDIIGNDVAAKFNNMHQPTPWTNYYAFDWRELYMSYDFLKSISPDRIIFNTESHLLTTAHSRDLYLEPDYVRATFWGAHTLGLNASQIWYWPRREDGSLRTPVSDGYAGSNNQQPRVTNEVHTTMIDLNTYSSEISKMQSQRKAVRIFYSKTSARSRKNYMDDIFELYEDLNFEGLSLGFATQNILNRHDNKTWDVVLVHKTGRVTMDELTALQTYLDNGGSIVMDATSLSENQYGQTLSALETSKGSIVRVNSLEEMSKEALQIAESNSQLPELTISETNTGGHKACTWKCVKNEEGNNVLSIINLGKTSAKLDISLKNAKMGTACKDLLSGVMVSAKPILKPMEVCFVEILDAVDEVKEPVVGILRNTTTVDFASLYPSPSKGDFTIELNRAKLLELDSIELKVFSMNGQVVLAKYFGTVSPIAEQINDAPDGIYIVQVIVGSKKQSFKFIKKQ